MLSWKVSTIAMDFWLIVSIFLLLAPTSAFYQVNNTDHQKNSQAHGKRHLLEQQDEPCNKFHHNTEAVEKSAAKAKEMLLKHPTDVPIEDRLLVMILFSRGFTHEKEMSGRLEYLRCSLLKLKANMMPQTTIDIFIWALNSTESHPIIPGWFNAQDFPRMNIIGMEPETWRIPCGLVDDSQWAVRKHFNIDYYLMGRWRLTFSLDFAKAMGYKYHLQFDDDAMLNQKLSFDIVQKFREHNYLMGVFSDHIGEVPQCTLGLPELTQYWLAIRKKQPKGPLYKHVNPPNMMGINSAGWDRMYHPGYFIIIGVDWWFSEETQDYLTTVLRSGRDVEGRWQEQAVMNMMRLVLVPLEQLWIMTEVDIGHDRHNRNNFVEWCVKTGIV
mmetsp:Transcript_1550/g.2631  ORF Transcript_1550/g.2631 Transcript_1550/m.2631 type:complete len:383 (-) Transcript_1550:1744-2892(-)